MSRRILHPIALILIGLGVIGFLFSMITNPLKMLVIFAVIAIVGVVGTFLYKRFKNKQTGGGMSGYNRAVKQSAKRYKKQRKPRQPSHLKVVNSKNMAPEKHRKASSLQKRKKEHNLKVIDGKKRKKKNRALF